MEHRLSKGEESSVPSNNLEAARREVKNRLAREEGSNDREVGGSTNGGADPTTLEALINHWKDTAKDAERDKEPWTPQAYRVPRDDDRPNLQTENVNVDKKRVVAKSSKSHVESFFASQRCSGFVGKHRIVPVLKPVARPADAKLRRPIVLEEVSTASHGVDATGEHRRTTDFGRADGPPQVPQSPDTVGSSPNAETSPSTGPSRHDLASSSTGMMILLAGILPERADDGPDDTHASAAEMVADAKVFAQPKQPKQPKQAKKQARPGSALAPRMRQPALNFSVLGHKRANQDAAVEWADRKVKELAQETAPV
jgi:hypothetical protein